MYKHILIATDGSEHALRAAGHGLDLATGCGAKVSVVTVTPNWRTIALAEIARGRFEEEYAERMRAEANICLAKIDAMARERGVSCETLHIPSDRPYEAILGAASRQGCDLIVVGAHGRRGLEGVLLGSETVKILTHSKVPVLVYRS